MKLIKIQLSLIFSLALFFLGINTVQAATITWAGGGTTNNWSEAANWDTDTVPGSSDTVIFSASSTKDSVWDASGPAKIDIFNASSTYTGTLTLGRDVIVNGNWTYGATSFNSQTYKITFDTIATFSSSNVRYYGLVLDISSNGDFNIDGEITVTDILELIDSPEIKGGAINLHGDINLNGGGYSTSGTIKINGTGDQTILSTGGKLPDMIIEKPSGKLYLIGDIGLRGNWTWNSGIVDAGTSTLTLYDSNITFVPGDVEYYNLTIYNSFNPIYLGSNLTIKNNFLLNGVGANKFYMGGYTLRTKNFTVQSLEGHFYAQTGNVIITGDFTHAGGSFDYGTSIVAFQGTNQTITGDTTFYKLYKLVNEPDTLYIASSTNITIAAGGVARLWGKPEGKTLSIRSTEDGSPYTITKTGSIEAEYVDIKDASFSATVTAAASDDSGGNTNLTVTKEFICTIRAAGGDYSTLSAWEAAVQTDLTAATTKVFSHSGLVGIIPDASTVEGLTSGATGTAIHVTDTQILIEDITGTFQSGEQVRIDGSNYVVIRDAGYGAIATARPYNDWPSGLNDQVTIDSWTTGVTNFVDIYVPRGVRHNGKWDASKFWMYSTDGKVISVWEDYVRIFGLQAELNVTNSGDNVGAIDITKQSSSNKIEIGYNVIQGGEILGATGFADGVYVHEGIAAYSKVYLFNNVFFDFYNSSYPNSIGSQGVKSLYGTTYSYNNTVHNSGMGFLRSGYTLVCKNCLSVCDSENSSFYDFSGSFTSSDYNVSTDNTATGTNSRINQTLTFRDEFDNDFHLAGGDEGARDHGVDLSVDPDFPIIDDIDGDSRLGLDPGGWDIGADEYPNVKVAFGSSDGGTKHADPIAYWKFDEGYGATAHDFSGNGYDGTANPGFGGDNSSVTEMWDLNGKFNRAMEFDGLNDYVNVGVLPISEYSAITYSVWFKVYSQGYGRIISSLYSGIDDIRIYVIDDVLHGDFDDSTAAYVSVNISNISDWHHVVLMHDGTYISMYLDGVIVGAPISDPTFNWSGMNGITYIGMNTGGAGVFDGLVDELKIFDYALTEDDIKQEYNQGMAVVLGSTGTDSSGNPDNSANRKYCVPGDTATCNPPVLELNMDEKQGMTAYDTSGNGNDGTLTNGPTWARGKEGSALSFDGDNDYMDVGDINLDEDVPALSVGMWVKSHGTGPTIDIARRYGTGEDVWRIERQADNDLYFYVSNGSIVDSGGCSGALFVTNNWHYVEGVYDGTNILVYLNGVLCTKAQGDLTGNTNTDATTPLVLGDEFDGEIDQFRIYDYARTPAQIAWDYNRGEPVAYWRFDECTGSTVYDWAKNDKNGTITIGASGSQTSAGTCTSGSTADAWYNGRIGRIHESLSLDGTDDYISVGDTSLNINSISFWTKQNYTDNYFIDLDGGTNTIKLAGSEVNTTGFVSPAVYVDGEEKSTVPDNAWHQITIVTDTAIDASNVILGKIGSNYFSGQFDEIRLFNYPLTAEQVQSNYSGGATSFGNIARESGSSLYFPCGQDVYNDNDSITYSTILADDGNCWLASNLGTANIATAYNDSSAYGAYYQWGRLADGHQISTSGTTATNSSGDVPGHGNFITESSSPYDWRVPQNDNLWQGVDGTNNPCPAGWRLPTQAEWATLVSAEGITNYTTAYASSLKLTAAGYRNRSDGSFLTQGSFGHFWSSSPNGTKAYHLYFGSSGVGPANGIDRAYGLSVRCLKN